MLVWLRRYVLAKAKVSVKSHHDVIDSVFPMRTELRDVFLHVCDRPEMSCLWEAWDVMSVTGLRCHVCVALAHDLLLNLGLNHWHESTARSFWTSSDHEWFHGVIAIKGDLNSSTSRSQSAARKTCRYLKNSTLCQLNVLNNSTHFFISRTRIPRISFDLQNLPIRLIAN